MGKGAGKCTLNGRRTLLRCAFLFILGHGEGGGPVQRRTGSGGPADTTLDRVACTGADLLLGFRLSPVSDSRIDRACGHPACKPVPGGGGAIVWAWDPPLVRPDCTLAFQRLTHADGDVLAGARCFPAADCQHLAARHAPDLLCLLSFLRQRGPGLFRIPIGRHAARSRISGAVLCSARFTARAWLRSSAVAGEPVPAAVGVVSHLLRIGFSEVVERRHRMASPDRDGRVLPERSPAYLDR